MRRAAPGRAACLPGPQPRHAARPHATAGHRHQLCGAHAPRAGCACGCGECKPATTQGTTRSYQQDAKLLPSTAGLLPHCYPTRYPAPGNSRNSVRIISLTCGGAMGIRTPDLLHAIGKGAGSIAPGVPARVTTAACPVSGPGWRPRRSTGRDYMTPLERSRQHVIPDTGVGLASH